MINHHFVLAVARIPAAVTGDGQHSVKELITYENTHLRTRPYESDLAFIDPQAAAAYLGEHLDDIPAAGEQVRVSGTCNLGQGGRVRDISAHITPEQRSTCELISRTLQLPVAGLDFFGDYIIEVNACPSLYYPLSSPASELAVVRYLEYLEQLP